MAHFIGILTDTRIASDITFIAGTEEEHNKAFFTVMINRRDRNNKEYHDEITVNAWGKTASIASIYCCKGKQVNIHGRISSWNNDTGQINGAGKKVYTRKTEIVATHIELLGDPMKLIEERVAVNLAMMKAAGRLPQEVMITAAELLKGNLPKLTDYNPEVARITGKYGNARVWDKTIGDYLDKHLTAGIAQPVQNVSTEFIAMSKELQELRALIAQQNGGGAAKLELANDENIQDAEVVGEEKDVFKDVFEVGVEA